MKKLFVLAIALLVISAPVFAAQLVVNGDFSTGDETGWSKWSSGDQPDPTNNWGSDFYWDASQGVGQLSNNGGSFGWYQAINVVQGAQYTINGIWGGNGNANWCEVLFFNDDSRDIYFQCDAPLQGSLISKVSGSTNGGMPFGGPGMAPITNFLCPVAKLGAGTNVITATGSKMYVVLKTGANGGSTMCVFDNITVEGPAVPEPGSIVALLSGLAGFGGIVIPRKR